MELKQLILIAALLSSSQSIWQNSNKAGLIHLHALGTPWGPDALRTIAPFLPNGLGIPGGTDKFCKAILQSSGLGLSRNTIVRCPVSKRRSLGILKRLFPPGVEYGPSWFNLRKEIAEAVVSPTPAEDKEDLMDSLRMIEEEIEELTALGVPSENIVVTGWSQGAAQALWIAIYSRYKLGGFVNIAGWLPLANVEPPRNLPFQPVNKDTPILHMAGLADSIVPVTPAGRTTARAMKEVFSDSTLMTFPSINHFTILSFTMPPLKKWLKENTNLKFKRGRSNLFGDIIGTLNSLSNKNPLDSLNSLVNNNLFGNLNPFGGWGR